MKYFLLQTDSRLNTAPEILDWFQRIDRRNIQMGKSYRIENRQLFFIKSNPNTFFPDVLSFPFFMVSEKIMSVIKLYEPKTIFKEIVLLDRKYAKSWIYYIPVLEYLDCLSDASSLTRDKSTILNAVINLNKVSDQSVFYVAGVGNLYTVARLDIVESILRRGAKWIELREVSLEEGNGKPYGEV